jgi:hypothetical protein
VLVPEPIVLDHFKNAPLGLKAFKSPALADLSSFNGVCEIVRRIGFWRFKECKYYKIGFVFN